MRRHLRALAVTAVLPGALFCAEPAWAEKQGGVPKLYTLDSPASMSILEEALEVGRALFEPVPARQS
jgi:hypothetical protein